MLYMMKLKYITPFILFVLISLKSWVACDAQSYIPPYFVSQLNGKIGAIKEKSREGASFVFITDTHVKSNEMHSPQLIRYVLDQTDMHTVIWGGDAMMQYGGTIAEQWKEQLRFDSILKGACDYYKVRGNHDFSILSKDGSIEKLLLSNEESANLLFDNAPSGIHRNMKDSGGCYYYFDNTESKLRFVIFDTTDSVPSAVRSWGNIPYVHDKQLQWIADSAISTTPQGYDLIFVSHIPIPKKRTDSKPTLWKVRQLIDGINSKSSGDLYEVKYDFTNLKDVRVLMCLAGHVHSDTQNYSNDVLYVTTANDGKWNIKTKKNIHTSQSRVGTVSEQCFDCFCISKDRTMVHAYRIGYGNDRHFHLEPLKVAVNRQERIKSIFKDPVQYTDLSAKKNSATSRVLSIAADGSMRGLRKGRTTVAVSDNEGNKDFFYIIVE